VRRITLISICIMCAMVILYMALDPNGFDETGIPYLVYGNLLSLQFPVLSWMFTCIIFHWAEIYYRSSQILKKEAMLERINKRYQSNVTLEDILGRVRFLQTLRIPFIVINALDVVLIIMYQIVRGVDPRSVNDAGDVWVVYTCILFVVLAGGFLFYGRRLLRVMPTIMVRKMKRMTNLISIQAVIFMLCLILGFVAGTVFVGIAQSFIAAFSLFYAALLSMIWLMLSLFVVKSKKFPWIMFKGTSSSRDSTKGSGKESSVGSDFNNPSNLEAEIEDELNQRDTGAPDDPIGLHKSPSEDSDITLTPVSSEEAPEKKRNAPAAAAADVASSEMPRSAAPVESSVTVDIASEASAKADEEVEIDNEAEEEEEIPV